mmetsp:Transcript_8745/g.22596  ORF Transcript_8745/g.22596 Transcript_8745/m.22596 type:complete len:210 (+) Transcript_8745:1128-1757(+)
MSARCSWHLKRVPGAASRVLSTARNGFRFLLALASFILCAHSLKASPTAFEMLSDTAELHWYRCTSFRLRRESTEMKPKMSFFSPMVVMKETCCIAVDEFTSEVRPSIARSPSSETTSKSGSRAVPLREAASSARCTVSSPRSPFVGAVAMCLTAKTPIAPDVPLDATSSPSSLSFSRSAVCISAVTLWKATPMVRGMGPADPPEIEKA